MKHDVNEMSLSSGLGNSYWFVRWFDGYDEMETITTVAIFSLVSNGDDNHYRWVSHV